MLIHLDALLILIAKHTIKCSTMTNIDGHFQLGKGVFPFWKLSRDFYREVFIKLLLNTGSLLDSFSIGSVLTQIELFARLIL